MQPFDGQDKKRAWEEFTDKHGRLYGANIEIKTGMPCEVLRPVAWKAPTTPDWVAGILVPPCDDYEIVKVVPRALRARRGYQIEINYVRWLQKWDEAEEALLKKIHDFAKGMTKSSGLMLELINNPPPELLKLVGTGPRRIPRQFIEAAAAGNQWALGLSDKVPAKAEAVLAMLKPLTEAKRRLAVIGVDPFADEDEDEQQPAALADAVIDPFGEEEERADPTASGGKTEPVRASKKRTPKRQPVGAAT